MTEIYFINDYYVKTTSWHNAVKSWLKYNGDASDIVCKAIDAMESLEEIIKMADVFSSVLIDRIGIVKDYYYFDDFYEPYDDGDSDNDNVNYS